MNIINLTVTKQEFLKCWNRHVCYKVIIIGRYQLSRDEFNSSATTDFDTDSYIWIPGQRTIHKCHMVPLFKSTPEAAAKELINDENLPQRTMAPFSSKREHQQDRSRLVPCCGEKWLFPWHWNFYKRYVLKPSLILKKKEKKFIFFLFLLHKSSKQRNIFCPVFLPPSQNIKYKK